MINSILIPVIVAHYIKDDLYNASGLVDNIFMMSITSSLIGPVLVYFDPLVLVNKLLRCIRSNPSKSTFIQIVNFIKARETITSFTWVCSSKLEVSTFTWSISLCLSAILFLCSRFASSSLSLVICLCIGLKNTAFSIDIEGLFQVLIQSMRQPIKSSCSGPYSTVLEVSHGLTLYQVESRNKPCYQI